MPPPYREVAEAFSGAGAAVSAVVPPLASTENRGRRSLGQRIGATSEPQHARKPLDGAAAAASAEASVPADRVNVPDAALLKVAPVTDRWSRMVSGSEWMPLLALKLPEPPTLSLTHRDARYRSSKATWLMSAAIADTDPARRRPAGSIGPWWRSECGDWCAG